MLRSERGDWNSASSGCNSPVAYSTSSPVLREPWGEIPQGYSPQNGVLFCRVKKECIYKVKTDALKMDVVKSMVFRFIEIHDNRKRIYTTNDGYPPLMKRDQYYRDQLSKVV